MVHYLLGRWGSSCGSRRYPIAEVPGSVKLIIMDPCLDKTFEDWFANSEVITWTELWEETMQILGSRFEGNAKVAVIPNANHPVIQFLISKPGAFTACCSAI